MFDPYLLDNNQLKNLPDFIHDWGRLEWLDLSENELRVLPELVPSLLSLKELNLNGNFLETLPDGIKQLKQLERLSLEKNLLTKLPNALSHLKRLRSLNLARNRLSRLPEFVGNFSKLERLDIADNQLTALPKSLARANSLKELFVAGNGLGLPEGIARRAPDPSDTVEPVKPNEILEYYFRISEGSRPLNEAKLILVGRGSVGKTSIVNRLIHDSFKDEKKTEGIKITGWKLALSETEEVQLNVWDFGGQEIMHATHQFFLTQRSLYLLVLSGREGGEDADAEYWLKLISSFGGNSPVIVILNKIKAHIFDVNRRALQEKYPFVCDFVRTDCKTGVGLASLRNIIKCETNCLEHLRDPFPASWFAIKERLSRMRKNFLSFDEYRTECVSAGEKHANGQNVLAVYLHSLGIALNYKEDPRLNDTHILNPHWVTDGIYKILNSNLLEKQKGEVSLSDVALVLDHRRYPPKMHRFLLELMKKFELCFTFHDDDARYLIPELLDKQQPSVADDFKPNECLNFEYHYSVLPEGLLPRFIVRTHVLSEAQPRWRTGVIMQFEGCRALVKADVQDRKVFISVSGPTKNRRRLLTVIRSDFERIHRDISNLRPEEMVPLPDHPKTVVGYDKLVALEQQEILRFPEFVGDQVVNIEVADLLNGIDHELNRIKRVRSGSRIRRAQVFISYSHRDENLRNELETHLKILQRTGSIDVWHDRKIEAGDEWKRKISDNLEGADIILLLMSADFIASDYCFEIEGKRALERHELDMARLVPIILRPCKWQIAEFGKLQALPKDGIPVTKWRDRDSAWLDVEERLERLVEQMHKRWRRAWA